MKQKHWKTAHTIAVIVAIGLIIAGVAGAFGQTRPESPGDTAGGVATVTVTPVPVDTFTVIKTDHRIDLRREVTPTGKVRIIDHDGHAGWVDKDLVTTPPIFGRGKAMTFDQAWEHIWEESADQRIQHGYATGGSFLEVYAWGVHILALIGLIAIGIWTYNAVT